MNGQSADDGSGKPQLVHASRADGEAEEALDAADLVDGLINLRRTPTLLVDRAARLITANKAGRATLAEGYDWKLGGANDVRRSTPNATGTLHAIIARVAAGTTRTLSRYAEYYATAGGQQQLIVYSKVAPSVCDGTEPQRAAVLVAINHGLYRHVPCDADLFIDAFAMTPTEARLSLALLEGHTLQSFAKMTGVRISTVRWHLRNALSKCNCSGQREFVRLLGSIIDV